MLPDFKKIDLNGTDTNHEIQSERIYFCRLKNYEIMDGQGHIIKGEWVTGSFDVYRGYCTFNCDIDVGILLSDILEVYEMSY